MVFLTVILTCLTIRLVLLTEWQTGFSYCYTDLSYSVWFYLLSGRLAFLTVMLTFLTATLTFDVRLAFLTEQQTGLFFFFF